MQLFIIFASTSFYIGFWKYINNYIRILGIILYLFFEFSYFLTAIMNPGIISPEYYLENYEVDKMNIKNYRVCRKCNVVMDLDKGVEHCSDCNICIIGNDHHCPWTTKCVGKNNIFMFKIFLVSIVLHIVFIFITTMIMSFAVNAEKHNKSIRK